MVDAQGEWRWAVVDWMGNGQLHYLALDEDGVLSDFRRATDTELADKRHLQWEDGAQMRFTQDVGGGRGRVKLCAVDWTGWTVVLKCEGAWDRCDGGRLGARV